jgi:uncharacterized OB-fold protein
MSYSLAESAPSPPPPTVNPSELTAPFWDAVRAGALAIQRCQGCQTYIHLPRPVCRVCGSFDLRFEPVSGRGVLYSFTSTHKAFHPFFADRVPYLLATVELEEQPGLMFLTNLVGVDYEGARIGMSVAVEFSALTPELVLPVFRPTGAAA